VKSFYRFGALLIQGTCPVPWQIRIHGEEDTVQSTAAGDSREDWEEPCNEIPIHQAENTSPPTFTMRRVVSWLTWWWCGTILKHMPVDDGEKHEGFSLLT
jgi:hypothetical protein